MDCQEATHGRVGSPQLFAEQGIANIVHAGPAIFRLNRSRQEAQFAHALNQVQGELTFLVSFACHWSYFLLGKLASLGLDAFLFICKLKVHQNSPCTYSSVSSTAMPSISINASSWKKREISKRAVAG